MESRVTVQGCVSTVAVVLLTGLICFVFGFAFQFGMLMARQRADFSPAPTATAVVVTTVPSLPVSPTPPPTPTLVPSPTPTPTATPEPTPTATPAPQVYIVQPGDTLSAIAARFGVTLEAILGGQLEHHQPGAHPSGTGDHHPRAMSGPTELTGKGNKPVRILILEPYAVTSHLAWAHGYQRHSRHDVRVITMPGYFWKWRMHGGAVTLARQVDWSAERPDLILASDMLDVTTLLALTRPHTAQVPVAIYFHENQLTYPVPPDTKRDLHYGWINYASALASDLLLFNSAYHRDEFFDELPRLLKHFPDHNNLETVDELRHRAHVLHPGVDVIGLLEGEEEPGTLPPRGSTPPLILWNQRWEYDKGPEAFFAVLERVAEAGVPFRLALAGESYRLRPTEFLEARERFHDRVVHFGYAELPRYRALLRRADVVVSTAQHEFFGIAVVEAIAAGAFPLLPRRLVYPEYIPPAYHEAVLYDTVEELAEKLIALLRHGAPLDTAPLREAMHQFDWHIQAPRYDALLERLVPREEG
ncbi:MAG: DUF3524 domain-containing protein [Ardenticatenia bacterium]|nr:DUF3524 domain-containing protein [Ardenticatenia bacterium]